LPPYRLAHLSDLHLSPPAGIARDFAPKRLLSRFAWRRKRYHHDPEALSAIMADLASLRPDHVAITGDLTNFSTPEEFAAAKRWLEALGPADWVTVSPGNHDALVATSDGERFAPWRGWLGDDGDAQFPHVRRRGPLALVNLCSATPTALHLAQGAIDPGQLARLPALLRELGAAGLFRVVLIHHPPAPDIVSERKALSEAAQLRAVLAAEGAELVLHGHAHEATVAAIKGSQTTIPVLGVPSASSVDEHEGRARWHEIAVAGEAGRWSVQVIAHGLARSELRVVELGRYRLNLAVGSSS
jgi:3',5'-cyclic AMP phosphodiesterase CpdA